MALNENVIMFVYIYIYTSNRENVSRAHDVIAIVTSNVRIHFKMFYQDFKLLRRFIGQFSTNFC